MKIFARIVMCGKVTVNLLAITGQIIRGLWKMSKLPRPCVSIFGGSRHFEKEQYYHDQAAHAARLLVNAGFSVLSGGGPGIMEAANCGAHETPHHGHRTLKIVIEGLSKDEGPNSCPGESVMVTDFLARKWLLIDYSIGFIIFPGGLGTMDELSDLMNLMQTGKLKRRTVVLIGTHYWQAYKKLFDQAQNEHFLSDAPPTVVITDDVQEAVKTISRSCQKECQMPPKTA